MTRDRENGISAIEVVIAASILAVALLAIASVFPSAYSNVDRSGEQTTAATLAQQRIEWLRNQSYTNLGAAQAETSVAIAGYLGYARSTAIEVDPPIVGTGVKQLTVTVVSPSGRSVQLITLIAQ